MRSVYIIILFLFTSAFFGIAQEKNDDLDYAKFSYLGSGSYPQ